MITPKPFTNIMIKDPASNDLAPIRQASINLASRGQSSTRTTSSSSLRIPTQQLSREPTKAQAVKMNCGTTVSSLQKRIPKDKVQIHELLSCGAFGEVYSGFYNKRIVAVKMLLPQIRNDMSQVNEFLSEAKLHATMEHPHIVSFIGIAWDSLSDVCVVTEYMDGGDLRSLLNDYKATRHPVGFDQEKVMIALHVCQALAYMHSLTEPVLHRDLKSRNILLNQAMEAKLTDFGISKERLDQTMTAGVGTSLWIAPEVLMDNKYDDKANIFSFGVVLSELDVHSLPYSKAMASDPSNQEMPWDVMVSTGALQVEFSQNGPGSMTELGTSCVAVDPSKRPTAAEVLYKLETILKWEMA